MNFPKEIEQSEKYCDSAFEYKHVILPKEIYMKIPKFKLLKEEEWRALGIIQTKGWVHYTYFKPEPHILLFRRPLVTNCILGKIAEEKVCGKRSTKRE